MVSRRCIGWGTAVAGLSLAVAGWIAPSGAAAVYDWTQHPDGIEIEAMPAGGQRCSLCHAGPGVDDGAFVVPAETITAERASWTAVGWDWFFVLGQASSGRTWTALAALNSDGDGCNNGFEIREPGKDPNTGGDCTLPLNEESWSTLKSLFSESR